MIPEPPPQSLEAERSILAACILDREAIPKAAGIVTPASFYRDAHALTFKALIAMYAAGQPVDTVTLAEHLRQSGDLEAVGGYVFIASLMEYATTAANVEAHARIVFTKARARSVRAGALAILQADPAAAPEDMQEAVARINAAAAAPAATRPPSHVSHGLDRLFTQGVQPAVPLGVEALRELDVNPGHLVVVGARPGVGKTAFLGTAALAAAREGWNVLFLSLEMPSLEIQQRLASAIGGIFLGEVKRADNPDLITAAQSLAELPIWVEDGHEEPRIPLDLEGIASLVKLFAATSPGRNLVLVDYLQFVRTRARFERRHELVGHVCRELKRLAVEAKVALLVAAQLSRQVEQRGKDAKPQMADLSESSDIEKNADKIVFIHRADGEPVLLRVAKNRQGACWTVEAAYNGPLCQFTDAGGGWV